MDTRDRNSGIREAKYGTRFSVLILLLLVSHVVPEIETDRCPAGLEIECRYENIAYDRWAGGRRHSSGIVPDSDFDTEIPSKLLPAKDDYDLGRGLKSLKERARAWKLEVRTPGGRIYVGRVKGTQIRGSEDSLVLETNSKGDVAYVPMKLLPNSVLTPIRDWYDPSKIAVTALTKPSEIARSQGLSYLTHGVTDVDILRKKLARGALYPMDPERDQWRIANYLEIVGPEQMKRVRMRRISLIFDLETLDREDYFITPLQNFGTRTERTVDATDKQNLAAIFWDIHGGHGTGGNEVVIKGLVSYSHVIGVVVEQRDFDAVLAVFKESKLAPPIGKRWENIIKVSPHFGPLDEK